MVNQQAEKENTFPAVIILYIDFKKNNLSTFKKDVCHYLDERTILTDKIHTDFFCDSYPVKELTPHKEIKNKPKR